MPPLLLLLLIAFPCESYRILGLFPHPGKSHFDSFGPLLRALAAKGHRVTVVGHFPLERPTGNYTDVSLAEEYSGLKDVVPLEAITGDRWQRYWEPLMIHEFGRRSCEAGLKNEKVQRLLKGEEFDLAIMEMFNTHCFAGVIKKLSVPFVGITSHGLMPWSHGWFGTPGNPSYVPVLFLDHSDRMGFFGRVENALVYVLHNLYYRYVVSTDSDGFSRKHLGEGIPVDFMNNASLVLVNVHYSLSRPRPLAPNVIEVGGMHIGRRGKLPEVR